MNSVDYIIKCKYSSYQINNSLNTTNTSRNKNRTTQHNKYALVKTDIFLLFIVVNFILAVVFPLPAFHCGRLFNFLRFHVSIGKLNEDEIGEIWVFYKYFTNFM